MGVKIVCWNV